MLHKFMTYLFPPRSRKERLPLLPVRYSSTTYRQSYMEYKPAYIELIIRYGYARTRADAQRVLDKYPGMSITAILQSEKRKRKFPNRWVRAWDRFIDLWRVRRY